MMLCRTSFLRKTFPNIVQYVVDRFFLKMGPPNGESIPLRSAAPMGQLPDVSHLGTGKAVDGAVGLWYPSSCRPGNTPLRHKSPTVINGAAVIHSNCKGTKKNHYCKIGKKYECRKKSEIRETTFQKDIRVCAREICPFSRKFAT